MQVRLRQRREDQPRVDVEGGQLVVHVHRHQRWQWCQLHHRLHGRAAAQQPQPCHLAGPLEAHQVVERHALAAAQQHGPVIGHGLPVEVCDAIALEKHLRSVRERRERVDQHARAAGREAQVLPQLRVLGGLAAGPQGAEALVPAARRHCVQEAPDDGRGDHITATDLEASGAILAQTV